MIEIWRPTPEDILRMKPRDAELELYRRDLWRQSAQHIVASLRPGFLMAWDQRPICLWGVMPELPRRGWFFMFFDRSTDELQGLPRKAYLRRARLMFRALPYDELRAWVRVGDERAERFARWFGFDYDCGPAKALAPDGTDQNLFLWRRNDGRNS